MHGTQLEEGEAVTVQDVRKDQLTLPSVAAVEHAHPAQPPPLKRADALPPQLLRLSVALAEGQLNASDPVARLRAPASADDDGTGYMATSDATLTTECPRAFSCTTSEL